MQKKLGLNLRRRHNLALPLFSSLIASPQLPTAKASCDWLSAIPSFDPLGNLEFGDCVFAATLNGKRVMAATTHRPVPDYTAKDALALYHKVVPSFRQDDPNTDQGSDFDAASTYWRTHGIDGTKIISPVRINPGNLNLIRLAIQWLGPIFVGLALPDNAEEQFDKDEPWSLVRGKPPNPGNGHEVMIGAYDGDTVTCVTWGREQLIDKDWLLACASPDHGGDIQAVVAPEWIRTIGLSPSELHLATIERDAGLLEAA